MELKDICVSAALAAVVGASGISATTMMPSQAHAADTEWKMHVVWVDARPEAQSYQDFADIASEKAGDSLDIKLFKGGSLGINDANMLRILPPGNTIQAAGLYPGYLSRDLPQYSYTLPPGVVSEPETLQEILPDLREIYETAYDEAGIELLGFVGHAVRDSHILCKEPVNSLEELKDKKVRVWEQFHVDVFDELGVSAQIIGQNDLYVAMQTGVVDCAVYPIGLAVSVSLQEVAPYASYLFPYVLHPLNILASEKSFEALSTDTQQVVQEAAETVQAESFDEYLSGVNDEKALETYRADGGELLDPFPENDREEFREAALKVWKEKAIEEGGAAEENYRAIREAIRQ